MNKIEEALTGYWGERCPDHEPECFACQAWAEYDKLVMKGPHIVVFDELDLPTTKGANNVMEP